MELSDTAGICGNAAERVMSELILRVGHTVSRAALESDVFAEFAVGHGGRMIGQGLATAVETGLLSAGVDTTRVDIALTPTLAFTSHGRRSIILTTSHNPPTDNSIKMFVDSQEYDHDLEYDIEARTGTGVPLIDWDDWGATGTSGVLNAYRGAVVEFAGQHGADLDGFSVAVDCGNGMSALGVPQVLRDLSARVVTLNGQIDDHFPGHESELTSKALTNPVALVADGDFDFGVGHDGDADHIVITDGDGKIVHENIVIAMTVERYVHISDAEDPIAVTTPNASDHISKRVRETGGRVEYVHLDALHEGIVSACVDDGDVMFAAEPWKHVHPSLGGWIDGVASTVLVARLAAESGIAGLRKPVTERPYRGVDVPCLDENKRAAMAALETSLPKAIAPGSADTEYGVRLEFADASWTLIRPSGTELHIRVYSEADDVGTLVDKVTAVAEGGVEAV